MNELRVLHDEIHACRRCLDDGFPIELPPLAWGEAPAEFMVVGQAPGKTDKAGGRMYLGPAAQKLFGWLTLAGFTPDGIGTRVYMTALTKCFPGRLPGKSTDRAPTPREQVNCRPWLDRQLALVRPRVLILFGKMAIDTFLGTAPLAERIGRRFEREGRVLIPLPHSSGASLWLNDAANRALLDQAIALLRDENAKLPEPSPLTPLPRPFVPHWGEGRIQIYIPTPLFPAKNERGRERGRG